MNHPWFHSRNFSGASLFAASLLMIAAAQPAHAQAPKPAPKAPVAASCDRAHFRMIIDVGHSEEVPGAISARGATEYSYNLNLAQKIHAKLREAGSKLASGLIRQNQRQPYQPRQLHGNNPPIFSSQSIDAVPDSF
jgi:N-acetylmuramoyl-L-alanine amidase